jgi:hypothetical protein
MFLVLLRVLLPPRALVLGSLVFLPEGVTS